MIKKVYILGLFINVGIVCLWQLIRLSMMKKIYFYCVTHAWDTGGPGVFACNLDLFLCEIVTCMSYGATFRVYTLRVNGRGSPFSILRTVILGGMVYFPEGYTPIVPTKSPVVNKIIYFLTILYDILIIKVTNIQ